MNFISIIPARGGSERLKRKNVKLLAGKPLIAYTIIEALKSELLNKVIISTEDSEIAKISENYGADVVKRPENISQNDTPTIDVIFHVMKKLKLVSDDSIAIVLLQPTSPLRVVKDINNSIKQFSESNCESLVSVCEVTHPYNWLLKIENSFLKPLFGWELFRAINQDVEKLFLPNGAIYIANYQSLKKYNSFYCDSTSPYIMPLERSIDIDTELDFKFAELLININ